MGVPPPPPGVFPCWDRLMELNAPIDLEVHKDVIKRLSTWTKDIQKLTY